VGGLPRRLARRRRLLERSWRPELPIPLGVGLLLPLALLLGLLFVLPLARIVELSITDPEFGVQRYRAFFDNSAEVKALLTTLKVSALVTVIALLVGSIVAWTLLTTRSRALRTALWIGTIFPLWMSVITFTYIFTILLQRHGIVNEALQFTGVTHHPVGLLYNTGAVVVAMVYVLLPLATLPLYASFVNIDQDLVRAAQSLGASRIRALVSIVIPLSLPAVLAAAALVFVSAMGFYITPVLLGSATEPFLASVIADQVGQQFDVPSAAAGSVVLLLIALAVMGFVAALAGRARLKRAGA
jgi:ABC-type spermidine/putrescine transport system permease subunit I